MLICFDRTEADEYVKIGAINGLFVLGRSVGFIGKSYCSFIGVPRERT